MLKRFLLTMMTVCGVSLAFTLSAYAKAPEEVIVSIEQDFKTYTESLNNNKESFGLTEKQSFSQAKLGEGYSYYNLSTSVLSQELSSITPDNFIDPAGYLFPIQIDKVTTGGVIFAENKDDKWKIRNVANNHTLDEDLAYAKSILGDETEYPLIYDQSYGFVALLADLDDDYKIIPLRDSETLNLQKSSVYSFQEVANKLHQAQLEKNEQEALEANAGKTTGTDFWKSPLVIGVSSLIVIIVIGAMLRRRKKKKSRMEM